MGTGEAPDQALANRWGMLDAYCTDCHNRPGHNFQAPNDAVDKAMAEGRIDPGMKAHFVVWVCEPGR